MANGRYVNYQWHLGEETDGDLFLDEIAATLRISVGSGSKNQQIELELVTPDQIERLIVALTEALEIRMAQVKGEQ